MLEVRVDYNEIDLDDSLRAARADLAGVEEGTTVVVRDPGDDAIYFATLRELTALEAVLDVDWDSAEAAAALVASEAAGEFNWGVAPRWRRPRNLVASGSYWGALAASTGSPFTLRMSAWAAYTSKHASSVVAN